jgi:hypothetical protein
MLKSMKINNNLIVVLLIIIEIIYIIFNCKELFKEKIDHVVSNEGNVFMKIISVCIMIIILTIIYYFTKYIEKKYNINFINTFILTILSLLILIEYKLNTNVYFSNITSDLNEVLKKSTTGDFILFRSYHSYDIPELFFYRYLNALFSNYFFGHIGIIINNDNKPYILECTEDFFESELTNKKKNGVVYHKAYDRINNYEGTVYICRNNLEKFIKKDKIFDFIEKYKNISFLENNIGCITFLIKFLEYFKLLKTEITFMLPYEFINKDIYKIHYKPIENIKIKNKSTI